MASQSSKNIAIVCKNIGGIKQVKTNGAGVANLAMAELFSSMGHKVEVILAEESRSNSSHFKSLKTWLRKRNIVLRKLEKPKDHLFGRDPACLSYAVYMDLSNKKFDLVFFEDSGGIGFHSLSAKKIASAFESTRMIVCLHAAAWWVTNENLTLIDSIDGVVGSEMEWSCLELAEEIIVPTDYAKEWLRSQPLKINADVQVIRYPLSSIQAINRRNDSRPLDSLVFLGHQETRKGLDLFLEAVSVLKHQRVELPKVIILGGKGILMTKRSTDVLKQYTKTTGIDFYSNTTLSTEEILHFLAEGNPLVCLPSRAETMGYALLECVSNQIPFIASDIPAFREIITDESARQVLVPLVAKKWAKKIQEALNQSRSNKPHEEIRLRINEKEVSKRWNKFICKNKLNRDEEIRSTIRFVKFSDIKSLLAKTRRSPKKSNEYLYVMECGSNLINSKVEFELTKNVYVPCERVIVKQTSKRVINVVRGGYLLSDVLSGVVPKHGLLIKRSCLDQMVHYLDSTTNFDQFVRYFVSKYGPVDVVPSPLIETASSSAKLELLQTADIRANIDGLADELGDRRLSAVLDYVVTSRYSRGTEPRL